MARPDDKSSRSESMITIYDIAQEMGLSASTVAKALNGKGRVSSETRKRVAETAAKMGYKASLVAKSLSNSRTYTLGVVVPMMGDTAYSAILNGIESVAYDAGYNIITCCSKLDKDRQKHYLEMLQSRRVEGIIIILASMADEDEIAQLTKIDDSGVPVVVHGQNVPDGVLTKVVVDDFGGAEQMTNHLIQLGHRRIGFLHMGEDDLADNCHSMLRLNGYKAALSKAGIPYNDQLVGRGAALVADDDGCKKAAFESYYKLARPTAVFGVNDMLAIKTIQECSEMALKVPEDIAVVGFDDILASAYVTPALTTVHQPATEGGKRAVDILLNRIDGKMKYHVKEIIQTQLVVRKSCGALMSREYGMDLNRLADAVD